jgi:hypothetical protein
VVVFGPSWRVLVVVVVVVVVVMMMVGSVLVTHGA